MNQAWKLVLLTLLVIATNAVLADDAPSDTPVLSLKQKMHACVTKQRAANPQLSDADLKKACRNEIKAERDHPSIPATPNNVPQT